MIHRWPTVARGGRPLAELRAAGANSGRRRRRTPGGRAREPGRRRRNPLAGRGSPGRQGAGRAAGGEANGRCGRRSERRRWYFAVGEVKRTEKKRAERMGVRGYFLARRQDLWRRARCHDDCHVTELDTIGCGAELCYLGATAYSAELRVQTCKLNFWGSKRKFLSPKGLKNKKFGP
jgi:hypothetical protein